jgi:hypothetical protein
MNSREYESQKKAGPVLLDRRFVTCRVCGWVHYVMTAEEKAANDHFLERYQLTEVERQLYEAAFRQCLRCESPADEFGVAAEEDLQRAANHLVTPVFVAATVGTH